MNRLGGRYVVAALCGVLSVGVVAGPELLAWLARPVVDGVPTAAPDDAPGPRTAPAGAEGPAPPAKPGDRAPSAPARASPSPAPPPAPRATPDTAGLARTTPLERGRHLARLFYGGQLDQVWAAFLPAVRSEWGSLSAFRAYRAEGAEAYGDEKSVLNERVTRDGGVTYYTRTATFERDPGNGWTLILGLDGEGNVQEFGVVDAGLPPQRGP